MTPLSFNPEGDATDPVRLSQVVELGYEHTIVDGVDGEELVPTLDADGNRIPRSYTVPLRVTAAQTFRAHAALEAELADGQERGSLEVLAAQVDAIVGSDIVRTIGTDRSVETVHFMRFLNWAIEALNLDQALDPAGN